MEGSNTPQPAGGSGVNLPLPPTVHGVDRQMLRDPLNFFLSITREYGDIVCYRPAPETAYLINHPDFVRHVLVDNARNYSKQTYSNRMFKRAVGDGLISSEGEEWRKQRRLMQPAFHHTRLVRYDNLVVEATHEMLERWEACYQAGQPVDIAREMAALTMTITTRALFGVNLGDEVNVIGEAVNRSAHLLERPRDKRLEATLEVVRQAVDTIVQERRVDFQDKGDLLSSMMLARDPETGIGMDDDMIRTQVMTLLLAGYETTANALSWTWYLLTLNPPAYVRMLMEVRDYLGSREPVYADLQALPYTRMCLDEGLRLFPPAWILGRVALGDDEIGGYAVPAGTVIAISTYTVHRHLDFWPDPERYDPERFLPARSNGRHKYAYIPFGAGPRQCIGNTFGLMEAALAIACVAQRFELRLMEGITVTPQPLYVLRPNRDMLMSLHK